MVLVFLRTRTMRRAALGLFLLYRLRQYRQNLAQNVGTASIATVLHRLVGLDLLSAPVPLVSTWRFLVGDLAGLALVGWIVRQLRTIQRMNVKDIIDIVGDYGYQWGKVLPFSSAAIKAMEQDISKGMRASLHAHRPTERIFELPDEPRNDKELVEYMRGLRDSERPNWDSGKVSGAVYHGGDAHVDVLNEVSGLYSIANPLHTDIWPSLNKYEAEVVAITAGLHNGGDKGVCGSMSSGGTESIFLATKAHRDWAREVKGITHPEIIACDTAHAAIDKACEILGITLVRVPHDKEFRACVKSVQRAITSDTIMIYSSAPNFPQGIIDDIPALGKIAQKYNVGLHVDSCLGGFFLPFARMLGAPIPPYNFEVAGVTSMSTDTHKYGYATKGTSVVLFRDPTLRAYMFFAYPQWTGGIYATPAMAGSRPGCLVAACWASIIRLGKKGFLEATKKIMGAVEELKRGITETPGLRLLGNPVSMIVAFDAVSVNIYRVGNALTKRGYSFSACQTPPCLHICVTLCHVGKTDEILKDIRECLAEVSAEPPGVRVSGTVGMYGMAAALPAGPVKGMVAKYCDIVLEV